MNCILATSWIITIACALATSWIGVAFFLPLALWSTIERIATLLVRHMK